MSREGQSGRGDVRIRSGAVQGHIWGQHLKAERLALGFEDVSDSYTVQAQEVLTGYAIRNRYSSVYSVDASERSVDTSDSFGAR